MTEKTTVSYGPTGGSAAFRIKDIMAFILFILAILAIVWILLAKKISNAGGAVIEAIKGTQNEIGQQYTKNIPAVEQAAGRNSGFEKYIKGLPVGVSESVYTMTALSPDLTSAIAGAGKATGDISQDLTGSRTDLLKIPVYGTPLIGVPYALASRLSQALQEQQK